MNKITYKFFQKYIANFIIILAIISISILTYQGGVIGAFSSNNTQPIFCGKEHNNTISLMFNVYMGNEYVEQIINVLEKNNVKATFFVGGIWVEKNNDCFMKKYNSGNEIASHGYWHKDHSKITDQQQINEINLTHELVRDLTGINMTLFAPPSGAYNKMTAQIAESLGYKTIMWSKDTIDWRDQDEELLYTRATNAAQAGDLILMHPTQATANCLDKIIKKYIELGLNIDTVSKNIS